MQADECNVSFFNLFQHKSHVNFWYTKIVLSDVPDTMLLPEFIDPMQVKLCTKYQRFMPPKFKDDIFPKPPEHVIDKVKNKKREE